MFPSKPDGCPEHCKQKVDKAAKTSNRKQAKADHPPKQRQASDEAMGPRKIRAFCRLFHPPRESASGSVELQTGEGNRLGAPTVTSSGQTWKTKSETAEEEDIVIVAAVVAVE